MQQVVLLPNQNKSPLMNIHVPMFWTHIISFAVTIFLKLVSSRYSKSIYKPDLDGIVDTVNPYINQT